MTFERSKSAGYVINHLARLFARTVDGHLQPWGLSSGSLPVFLILRECGPLSQTELARQAAIEQPTMAATLARMERDGLVFRAPHPVDRRSFLYSLKDETRAGADAVIRTLDAINATALSAVPEERRTALVEDLGRMAAALDRQLKSGPTERTRKPGRTQKSNGPGEPEA